MPKNDLMILAGCAYTKREVEKFLSYGTRRVYATCDLSDDGKPEGFRWFRVSAVRAEDCILYAKSLNTGIWYPVGTLEVR